MGWAARPEKKKKKQIKFSKLLFEHIFILLDPIKTTRLINIPSSLTADGLQKLVVYS